MKNELIEMIMQKMLPYLDNAQLEKAAGCAGLLYASGND